jgi:aldehyde:ferredoxin oxidoreductase
MLKGVTGLELDRAKMRSIAGAITDNTRRFNVREGLTPEEDMLPKRFYNEVLPETGKIISEEMMEALLKDYYAARGWDEQGHPSDQTS